jgi:aspartate racemase
MSAPPVLGIIGGMGPEATVELMRRIIARTPARDDADHLHLLVESSPAIPSRIAHLVDGTGIDPTPELVRIARNLQSGGATRLAMPCNTAHGYAPAIRAAVTIPLLDMVALTAARVATDHPGRRVGLLASTAVHATKLYARALAAHGRQVVGANDQAAVMALIRDVKRGQTGTDARARLHALVAGLAPGADVIVIACTELSVLASGPGTPVPLVDALDVLVDAILATPPREPAAAPQSVT